jgi:hypothetical protein
MTTYDMMPGVPAAGHVSGGGFWHPGPAHHCTKCEPRPQPGTEAAARFYLQRDLSYGIAADVTITDARRHPGRYAYTPDGCAWVTVDRRGRWSHGRSSRAEQHLAHDRRAAVATRIDPDRVAPGDRLTYTALDGRGGELAGEASHALPGCVWIIPDAVPGCSHLIGWTRVTGHWPQGGNR